MIVSHRWKFIFLKTTKTAGTSLELALSAADLAELDAMFAPPRKAAGLAMV